MRLQRGGPSIWAQTIPCSISREPNPGNPPVFRVVGVSRTGSGLLGSGLTSGGASSTSTLSGRLTLTSGSSRGASSDSQLVSNHLSGSRGANPPVNTSGHSDSRSDCAPRRLPSTIYKINKITRTFHKLSKTAHPLLIIAFHFPGNAIPHLSISLQILQLIVIEKPSFLPCKL